MGVFDEALKAELHIHFDGSFDAQQLFDAAKRLPLDQLPESIALPWNADRALPVRKMIEECKTVEDFENISTPPASCRSLFTFLESFFVVNSIVHLSDDAFLEHQAYTASMKQLQANVLYTEFRYSPHALLPMSVSGAPPSAERLAACDRVVNSVAAGITRAMADFKPTDGTPKELYAIRQVLCMLDTTAHWCDEVAELAIKYKPGSTAASWATSAHPVVAADIASGEFHFAQCTEASSEFVRAAEKCLANSVPLTIHASESDGGDALNAVQAVVEYGASRIGHGYQYQKAVLDESAPTIVAEALRSGKLTLAKARRAVVRMQQASEQEAEAATDLEWLGARLISGIHEHVHFECCPTSSLMTGAYHGELEKHPLRLALTDGKASINTDDPAMCRVWLTEELQRAANDFKLGAEVVLNGTRNAVRDAAWDDGRSEERVVVMRENHARLLGAKL